LVGGLTITNVVKSIFQYFLKNLFKSFKTIFNAAIRVMISAAVFVLLFLYRLDWDYMRIFTKTGEQYENFQTKSYATLGYDFVLVFWGKYDFSNFVVRDYHNKKGFHYNAIFMDVFTSVPYIFVARFLFSFFGVILKISKTNLYKF
jgi:predicted thioredoxin/glutaredoxin